MKREKDEELFVKELLGENPEEKTEETEKEVFPKEAVLEFANAIGKEPEEVFAILEKGSKPEENSKNGDSEVFEKLAEIRGISKEEMKNEILWALEKAETEKMVGEILLENPGMNRETAKELALFRKKAKKMKNDEPKDKSKEMLFELDEFIAKHSGEAILTLANSVIEEWESGIPLETAFEKYMAVLEKKKLFAELEKMKNEKIKEEQKNYAKEFGPGSANSAAGVLRIDEFAAGLFREY